MSKQDTTNFRNVELSGGIEATGTVKGAIGDFGSVIIPEINGRTDTIVVIPTMATKAVTLTDEQKVSRIVEVTVGHATNVLTLGLAAGQSIVVKNNDAAAVVLVKNVAADTELSIAASGSAFIVAGTAGAMISIS